jgi:hypothetical protein
MSRCVVPGLCLGLTCAIWAVGCQSSADGLSRAPSFGIDRVPRQTEPALDEADDGRVAAPNKRAADEDDDESSGRKGNLLTRLLPGREKESPERKSLPVNAKTTRTEQDDDSLDF